MKVYPSRRYHPTQGSQLVMNEQEDAALGPEWVMSPADYGHETCPGRKPDPAIAAKKAEYEARIVAHRAQAAPTPIKKRMKA